MGWNPYNAFSCSATESTYRTQAQALVNLGLDKLGYKYVVLDSGWQGTARNASGAFTWSTSTIPSGIPALSKYIHDLGLKFGMYSDAGYYSCDCSGGNSHYLASLNHEAQDAQTFADWGADYLKYDNCFAGSPTEFVNHNPSFPLQPRYEVMRNALAATKRPIVFSICEWGLQDPARWAGPVGNSWRMSNDIAPPTNWDSVVRIINQVVPITGFAKPGAWNDLDMLIVGNSGLTTAEAQTHFAFWAAAKSPLLIGTDLTKASSATLDILKNPRIIALNQDSLGKSIAFKRRYTNSHDVWSGPLADGSTVVLVINWQNSQRSLTLDLADVGVSSASAVDLISGASLGTISKTYTTTVAAHGSIVLKLSGISAVSPRSFTFYNAADSANTLAGGAVRKTTNSTVEIVGNVGSGGTLTFNNVDGGSSGGTKVLSFDYINAEYHMSNTGCTNCRFAYISVNGGATTQVSMPISGQSWNIAFNGYLLSLAGFNPGKTNKVTISNPSGWAPDFVRMGVAN